MRASGVGLVLVVGLAACGGRAGTSDPAGPTRSSARPPPTTPPANVASAPGLAAEPALLAPEASELGGGVLRARLPWGVVTPRVTGPGGAGLLVTTTHAIRLAEHDVFVSVVDSGASSGDDFEARVIDAERVARCGGPSAEVVAGPTLPAPPGFRVVAFRPTEACSMEEPPELRLWVREPDGTVVRVELFCADAPCRWGSPALLEAFVGSFSPGAPTPAPAGERQLGAIPDLAVRAQVPEGFLVSASEGEDYVIYEVFRRAPLGTGTDGLTVGFYYSASPNSLQQDYRARDARTRMVPGRIGGRRTRFLEIVKEGRTRLVGRISMATVQLDFELTATTPGSLDELRAIVEGLELPEDVE